MKLPKEAVIGLAAAGVAVVGVLVAVATQAKPAAPTPAPTPTPTPPKSTPSGPNEIWQLLAGHEYLVTQYAAIGPPPSLQVAQAFFDALVPGVIRVDAVTPVTATQVQMRIGVLKDISPLLPSTMTVVDVT